MFTLLTAVVTILIFLVLISLHEFGHFIMAKMSGVHVLEFSVGMGPALFKKPKGETLYTIRALPIGGYCKLEGEDEESDNERAFGNQKLWKRFLVISAGAILNLILGFVLVMVLVGINGSVYTTQIDKVVEHTYMAQTDVMPGDKIVAVNGRKLKYFANINSYLKGADLDEDIHITVKRGKEKLDFYFKLSFEESRTLYEADGADITTIINGAQSRTYRAYTDKQREIYSEQAGKEETTRRYILGFEPVVKPVTIANIFPQSYYYTTYYMKMVYQVLGNVFTGETKINEFSGPVGAAAEVNNVIHSEVEPILPNILALIASITFSLGIFNLLPLPALDGGRLFFLLIELIFRKPVPAEKEGMVHTIGLILLLALAAVILVNDIIKLF